MLIILQNLSLYLEWKLKQSVKPQMDAISKGFFQIVPFELAKMFDSNGLQVNETKYSKFKV